MNIVVLFADEDRDMASGVSASLVESGSPLNVSMIQFEDEGSIRRALERDPSGDGVFVVLASRALSSRIRSLVAFDQLLGTRNYGTSRCVPVILDGERAPSAEIQEIVTRHGGFPAVATHDGTALRILGHAVKMWEEGPAATKALKVAASTIRVTQNVSKVRLAVVVTLFVLAALTTLVSKCAG